MKRLFPLLFLTLGFCALAAHASPNMAQMWGKDAASLEKQTADLIANIDMGGKNKVPEDYILTVSRFGRTAGGLAIWNDNSGGPKDLGCIFRGMSEESENQTLALLDVEDVLIARDHLKRLEGMFSDAQLIARAAAAQSPTPSLPTNHASQACPMELEAARRALQ